MRTQCALRVFPVTFVALALLFPLKSFAQTSTNGPRITQAVNNSQLTTLHGNTHPLAKAKYDQGAVADGQPIKRMLLLLQGSPTQESALRQLIDQQQSKASPSFHRWLTPEQFGAEFGASDADIQTVTSWLTSQGFQVNRVAAGRRLIEFSGTAGEVRQAFHTEIHAYLVNGKQHYANATDPQIPTALTPVVVGPVSLNNFKKKAQSHKLGVFRRTKATGQVVPVSPLYSFAPCGSVVTGAGPNCNALGPGDFAAIYSLNNLYAQGTTGSGETIALVGDSEICTASSPDFGTCSSDDASAYRSQFGLPLTTSTGASLLPQIIVDGPDPGFNEDETEGDLDTQLSGAVAREATIDFVVAEDTESTAGIDLAAEYIVDNNLAPVMSESFGECEAGLGNDGNVFYSALWEQAAAQGITVILSAGDSGSANCDDEDTEDAAEYGVFVSGLASTPFNVAAGGTDFNVTVANYETTYWSSGVNSTVNGIADVSATQYIPETSWNDSCAQSLTNSVTGCNPANVTAANLNIVAGGGGQSNCAEEDEFGDCIGYYPKPSWQTVAKGSGLTAATDLARDLPDIALFSADGLVSNSFYVVCESDISPTGQCDIAAPYYDFIGVGGTSSAAPAFAGIMALINQQLGPQGQADYVLYNLAQNYPTSFNDVTLGNNSVPCVGESANCSLTTASDTDFGLLETLNASGNPSGTAAFNAGTGLDLATGLGSINAQNLLNNWTSAVGKFKATTTTLCLSTTETSSASCSSPITITHGQQVFVNINVDYNGTAIPVTSSFQQGEDVSLIGTYANNTTAAVDLFTSNNYVISNADIYPLTNGVFSSSTAGTSCTQGSNCNYTLGLVGGTYTVAAHYAGDGTYGVSNSSPGISVTVNPENSTTTESLVLFSPITGDCVVSPVTSETTLVPDCEGESVSTEPYGSLLAIRVDVVGATSQQESATGNVIFSGLPAAISSTYPLNTEGYAEIQSPGNYGAVSELPQIEALPPGSYSIGAQYCGTSTPPACTGNPSYNASTAATPLAFSITQGTTETALSSNAATGVTPGTPVILTAFVDTIDGTNYSGGSFGAGPSGSINFMNGQTVVGTGTLTLTYDPTYGFSAGQATATISAPAATTTYTAQFTGDTNYSASPSAGSTTVTVTVSGPIASVPSSLSFGTVLESAPTQMPLAVKNTGTTTLTVSNVSISATNLNTMDFTQTNNCGGVSPNGSCTITVTFTPSSTSQETATLTITDNSTTGTSQMVALSGTGGNFTEGSASPASGSVAAGGTATTSVEVSPPAGGQFPTAVTFSASGVPNLTTVTFTPTSLAQTSPATNVMVQFVTTAPSSGMLVPAAPQGGARVMPMFGVLAALLLGLLAIRMHRSPRWSYVVPVLVILALAGMIPACGGGGPSTTPTSPSSPGTTPNAYTITITATSGNIVKTSTYMLTVTQ